MLYGAIRLVCWTKNCWTQIFLDPFSLLESLDSKFLELRFFWQNLFWTQLPQIFLTQKSFRPIFGLDQNLSLTNIFLTKNVLVAQFFLPQFLILVYFCWSEKVRGHTFPNHHPRRKIAISPQPSIQLTWNQSVNFSLSVVVQ